MSILMRTAFYRIACRTKATTSITERALQTWSKPAITLGKAKLGTQPIRLLSSGVHDHTKMWILEKALSVGLLAVIPAAFVCQSQLLDYALALSLVAHVHWGFEAIVVDYVRPSIFGPVIPKAALGGLYLISILALAGLFYLNYSDVGLSTAVRMIAKA